MIATQALRTFALVSDADDPTGVIGYGFVLPDGTAVSVSWPPSKGFAYYSSQTAEETALLRGADLLWMDPQERWGSHGGEARTTYQNSPHHHY